MIKKNITYHFVAYCIILIFPGITFAKELSPVFSLQKVMTLADKNSNFLSEAKLHEIVAEKNISIARADYFPTVDAQAIESTGFPASNNLLGVSGIMGSPYRSGVAGGAVVQQTLFDFGRRSHAVKEARYNALYSKETTKLTQYEVETMALEAFYDCENDRTQRDTWRQLKKESAIITKEATHFVRTGQQSIVDGYLSQAQTEKAKTAQEFYSSRLKESMNELAIIMGVSKNSFSCPILTEKLLKPFSINSPINQTVIVMRAMSKSEASEQNVSRVKADYYPKIIAEGSVGGMQKSRLVPINDYALGIGLSVPIFDMGRHEKLEKAEAQSAADQENVDAKKQYLQEANKKYDEVIDSSRVKLKYLSKELDLANKAFNTAKRRYFSLQGTLVDLREAFDNLARTQTEINNTRTQLLKADGAKTLLNSRG